MNGGDGNPQTPFQEAYIPDHHRRDFSWRRCLRGGPQERASFVAGAVLGGCAGLLFVSGTDGPTR